MKDDKQRAIDEAWDKSATRHREADGTGLNRRYSAQEAWKDGCQAAMNDPDLRTVLILSG